MRAGISRWNTGLRGMMENTAGWALNRGCRRLEGGDGFCRLYLLPGHRPSRTGRWRKRKLAESPDAGRKGAPKAAENLGEPRKGQIFWPALA